MSELARGLQRVALDRPLLGAHLDEVARALASLADQGALAPRLQLRRADLERLAGSPHAGATVELAARQAEEAGDHRTAWLARLQAWRWSVEDGARLSGVPTRPPTLPADAELRAEEALLEAAMDPRRAREAWGRALDGLPSPRRDHDRLAVHEVLARAEREVGDRTRAREHLAQAIAIARRHDSGPDELRLCLLLATVLCETGQAEATQPLTRCLELAPADSWQRVAAASILASLQLSARDWSAARATTETLMTASRLCHNWLGLADGAIGRAACQVADGQLREAIHGLLAVATEARAASHEATVNLIKARLAELRQEQGPAAFDAALQASPPPAG